MFQQFSNPIKFVPLAKSLTRKSQLMQQPDPIALQKKHVVFLDEAIQKAKKDLTFTPQDFMKYIDKFISKEKTIVVLALDSEYETYLDQEK